MAVPKQIMVRPVLRGAEGSLEKTPSLRSHLLGATPSLHSSSSDQVATLPPPASLEPGAAAQRAHSLDSGKEVVDITINWFSATLGLLFICAILIPLVFIMSSQVDRLLKTSKEQTEMMRLQNLILTEILQQLQVGKVLTCSVCRIQWVQHGDNCYLFRERAMSWRSSMGFCKDESSTLMVINTTDEAEFLRLESKKYFDSNGEGTVFYKFWIGLKYEPDIKNWVWADGTILTPRWHGELAQKGCLYLQGGKFYSQDCKEVAYVICKRKVQFGWR